jgi:hypothetical protein
MFIPIKRGNEMEQKQLIEIRDDSSTLLKSLSEIIQLEYSKEDSKILIDGLNFLEGYIDKLINTIESDPDKITRKELENCIDWHQVSMEDGWYIDPRYLRELLP